ncbi:MAG: phytanoyl-CoA dioxygenase family protein [Chitinophagales bacterium]|nr:phytanoyl-CoA dioxygenase family protein [Chitinophagales bacterium]
MKGMFHDSEIQKKFDRDGYVIIDLLSKEQVDYFIKQYFDMESERKGNKEDYDIKFEKPKEITYEFTFIDASVEYKKKVFNKVVQEFKPLVDKYLVDFQPIIANYIHKTSYKGEVPMHQNWAFVDEWKYSSISVWCPLVDSFKENGALQVVPGSHKRFAPVRGPLIPWELEHLKEDIIKNDMVTMSIKAGQAVILDDSIIHYSAPNMTDGLRLAIQLIMIPPRVPSIHYHMTEEDGQKKIKVYEVDQEFYMNFHPWLKPKGQKLVDTFNYKKVDIDYEKYKKMMKRKAVHERGLLELTFDKIIS